MKRMLKVLLGIALLLELKQSRTLADYLFVSGSGDGGICEFNTTMGANNMSHFASNNFFYGLACDGSGNLFAASGANIFEFATNGIESTFASGLDGPFALASDNNGNLFASENTNNHPLGPFPYTIDKFAPDGSYSTFITPLDAMLPIALACDASGDLFGWGPDPIYKFAPDGSQSAVGYVGDNSDGLACDRDGNLFASAYSSGNIYKFTPDGAQSTFATGLNDPEGMAFDHNGNLFVADSGSGNIYMFATNGSRSTFASGLNLDNGRIFLAIGSAPVPLPLVSITSQPQPQSQTVSNGSTVTYRVVASGFPPLTYQWYFDGTNAIAGATNAMLSLTNLQPSNSGAYTVAVTALGGTTVSSAVSLSVLPYITINLVPAISMFGGVGYSYSVQYINALGPTNGPWTTLATVTLTNSPQFYFDPTAIGQPARFYRIVQAP